MQINWPVRGLYAITSGETDTRRLLLQVEPVLSAGAAMLQYRAKQADPRLRLEQAIALRRLCARYDVPLIINDDATLAQAVKAAGVHLGSDDADLRHAREILGPQAIVGASCYADLKRAQSMTNAGASYLAFGAIHPSPTKPQAARASLELLQAAQSLDLPLVAIGGILPEHVAALHAAGAALFAVITGLWNRSDSAIAASAYITQWDTCEHLAPIDPNSTISRAHP